MLARTVIMGMPLIPMLLVPDIFFAFVGFTSVNCCAATACEYEQYQQSQKGGNCIFHKRLFILLK
jgi:hypothetical protein